MILPRLPIITSVLRLLKGSVSFFLLLLRLFSRSNNHPRCMSLLLSLSWMFDSILSEVTVTSRPAHHGIRDPWDSLLISRDWLDQHGWTCTVGLSFQKLLLLQYLHCLYIQHLLLVRGRGIPLSAVLLEVSAFSPLFQGFLGSFYCLTLTAALKDKGCSIVRTVNRQR